VRVPGLPDAYDYEAFPQEVRHTPPHHEFYLKCSPRVQDLFPVALYIQGVHRCLLAADGAIMAACSTFDGEALFAIRQWLGNHGQQVWAVGPLEDMPPGDGEVLQHSEEDAKILEFLDWMQATRGERSVIFVRRAILRRKVLTDTQVDLVRDRVLPEEPYEAVRLRL
jgi:hypothetical protein